LDKPSYKTSDVVSRHKIRWAIGLDRDVERGPYSWKELFKGKLFLPKRGQYNSIPLAQGYFLLSVKSGNQTSSFLLPNGLSMFYLQMEF
jgi:hypothetical protein